MDILLLILLLVAAVLGWHMGLIQQVVSLLGFGVSLVAAWALCGPSAEMVKSVAGTGDFASRAIAFALIALVGTIVLSWIAALATHIVDAIHLGCVNRSVGVVVSVAKYGLLLGFILKVLIFVGTLSEERVAQSYVAPTLTRSADVVLAVFAGDASDTPEEGEAGEGGQL